MRTMRIRSILLPAALLPFGAAAAENTLAVDPVSPGPRAGRGGGAGEGGGGGVVEGRREHSSPWFGVGPGQRGSPSRARNRALPVRLATTRPQRPSSGRTRFRRLSAELDSCSPTRFSGWSEDTGRGPSWSGSCGRTPNTNRTVLRSRGCTTISSASGRERASWDRQSPSPAARSRPTTCWASAWRDLAGLARRRRPTAKRSPSVTRKAPGRSGRTFIWEAFCMTSATSSRQENLWNSPRRSIPGMPRCTWNSESCCERLEIWKRPLAPLETAARQAPNDPAIQYALAGVYRQLGQRERSASAMQRFLRMSPSPR